MILTVNKEQKSLYIKNGYYYPKMDSLLSLIWILGKNLSNPLTIMQLAKTAKVPYATAYRTIEKYKSLFKIIKIGNVKLCSLNLEDKITKHYLMLAERQEAELFLKINPELSILKKELPEGDYSCILFGSRAEQLHRKNSDLDICIINKDGSKNIKFSNYELLFKIEINALYLSKKEFKQMLNEKEHNIVHEIIKKHIILFNEEYFWNGVFENGV